MASFGNRRVSNVRVIKLVMIETGTYNDQYLRPYNTNVDGTVMGIIADRVNQNSTGFGFNAAALSGIAGMFITPQANPESNVGIVGGWNERRIRFLMEIECFFSTGGSNTAYIQGYSNFMGVAHSGAVAPDMVFYINSVVYTRKVTQQTPFGSHVYENVVNNSHVLYNNHWDNAYQPGQTRLLRPQDIYKNIATSHLPGVFDQNTGIVYDGSSTLRNEATMSSRAHGLAGTYAANIIDSYCKASEYHKFGQNEEKVLEESRNLIMDEVAAADPFIRTLMSVTEGGLTNHFTYRDLLAIDPNADNVAMLSVQGQTQQLGMQTHVTGMTQHWHGGDRNTVSATVLSQAVPSIMLDLMIKRIAFKSTNHTVGGVNVTTIVNGESFTNMDMTNHFNMFINRLETQVIKDITFGGQDSYALEMRVDLLGETWISIAVGSGPLIDYVTPSFCDALFAPVITNNIDTVQNITNDFSNLITSVRDVTNSKRMGGLPSSGLV